MLVLLGVSSPALANGPPPPPWLNVELRNLPENAVFADILIEIGEGDPNFIHVNEGNLARFGLYAQAEIVGLNVDGFMSFTFHYRDAAAEIYIDEHRVRLAGRGRVAFGRGEGHRGFGEQLADLRRNYRDMKIVLLDYAGNVISVSDQFTLPEERQEGMLVNLHGLDYDHQTGEVRLRAHVNSFVLFGAFLLVPVIMLFSIGIEIVVGRLFGFSGKKLLLILCVNAGTQAAMWLAYFGFMARLPHLVAIIILEMCIYVTEFVVYRKSSIMADESTRKILLYTIIANTLSLILGVIVFWG